MEGLLDGVFVINLDSRTDRLGETIEELARYKLPFERFPAIVDYPGTVGCGKSHIACLKLAKERGYKNVLILEDDIHFLVDPDRFWATLSSFVGSVPYDVLMLSYSVNLEGTLEENGFLRVQAAQDAAAYLVHESFYDRLIETLETGVVLLQVTGHHWLYANDQSWKQIQPSSRWYATPERCINQRDSPSDTADTWIYTEPA
jgi:GR25 family glycosyltransferase involved in LPS biosynthesis